LSYEKKKSDVTGYLYGYFPVKDIHQSSNETVYIFKNIKDDNEIVFTELDLSLKERAKNVLIKVTHTSSKEPFEILDIFGYKSIRIKNVKNKNTEYSISIPDLDLHIVTSNMESLLNFKITKA